MKRAEDFQVGDTIVFLNTPHRFDRIEPYVHPCFPDEQWRVGYDSRGWGITLVPGMRHES